MLALVLAASLAPAQQPTGYRLPPQQSRQRFALEFDVETIVKPRFYRVPEMADRDDYCPMPRPQPRYYANDHHRFNQSGGGGCYGGEPYGGGYANGGGAYRNGNGNGYAAPPPRQRYYDNSRYYEGPCPPGRALPQALPRIGVRESYGPPGGP